MGHARGTVSQRTSEMAGGGTYNRAVSYVGFVLDDDSTRDAWSAVSVDFSSPRALPLRDDRRQPPVDHRGRVSRLRFGSPHPEAINATKRQRRIDRRKFGSAAAVVRQASCILRHSKNPAARSRAFSALKAALRAASSEMRRLLLALALHATSPGLSLSELSRRGRVENDADPPGRLVVTTPAAPHAPPPVAVAPHEGWTVAVAVG